MLCKVSLGQLVLGNFLVLNCPQFSRRAMLKDAPDLLALPCEGGVCRDLAHILDFDFATRSRSKIRA